MKAPSAAKKAQGQQKPDLDHLYKPVGIAAINAATLCSKPKAAKKQIKK